MNRSSKYIVGIVVGLLLLIFLIPLSLKVSFMQNDDWYYYQTVQNFLNGNYTLHPDIAPTFYLQGFLGSIFSLIFSVERLPILTLIASVLAFVTFYLIIRKYYSESSKFAVLAALVFFFNPIFNYSVWGFMTEAYFIFFQLVSVYFFIGFLRSGKRKSLYVANIFALLNFFVRQVSLVFFIASGLYLIVTKKYKEALLQFSVFFFTFLYYSVFFPKTNEMVSKGLQFQRLFDFDYIYAVIYGSAIYLFAFSIPFVLFLMYKYTTQKSRSPTYYLFLLLGTAVAYVFLAHFFKPQTVSWEEFPYFENIFERKGFYPRSIHGTKYHFVGIHDLYLYWDLFSKILLTLFITIVVLRKKINLKSESVFYLIVVVTYLGVFILAETFYDRYLSVVIPIFLLFLLSQMSLSDVGAKAKNFFWLTLVVFTFFLGFFSFNLARDFISVESYVWSKSQELVNSGVSPDSVYASSAWNEKYVRKRDATYIFSYDSTSVNPDLNTKYELLEEKSVGHLFNIFIEPKIYMYKVREDP